jgi:hypothetical protein
MGEVAVIAQAVGRRVESEPAKAGLARG